MPGSPYCGSAICGYVERVAAIRLGDLIRNRREELDVTRATLASRVCANQWTTTTVSNELRFRLVYEEIRKIEDGELNAPGLTLLVSIMLELDLDVGVFAAIVEPREAPAAVEAEREAQRDEPVETPRNGLRPAVSPGSVCDSEAVSARSTPGPVCDSSEPEPRRRRIDVGRNHAPTDQLRHEREHAPVTSQS